MTARRLSIPLSAMLLALALAATARASDTPSVVSAGATHTCALLVPRGAVACWGEGVSGQLGDGTSTASPAPVTVTGVIGATAIAAGEQHSCAVVGGGVDCWGNTAFVPGGTETDTPVAVQGVSGAVAVTAGSDHSCALLGDGGVDCWGLGASGELGDGTTTDRTAAGPVTGIASAVGVSAGAGHTCAVLSAGTVDCWGRGRDGELGNGATADSATPVAVTGISSAIAVTSGTSHSCALLRGGGVACWGAGDRGQLGNGAAAGSATPVPVTGVTGAVAVTAGGVHTCAALAGGAVVCWGFGGSGELGTGARTSSATPVAGGVRAGATSISAGLNHTCAVVSGGVKCWGAGDHGQLGDGAGRSSPVAVDVVGLTVAPPVLGRSTTLQPVVGRVLVRRPGAGSFTPLTAATSLPVGTTVDATGGRVRLTSAADAAGRTQSGLFYGGVFRTGQSTGGATPGLTVITLAGPAPSGCGAGAAAAAAVSDKKKRRHVWGDAKGNFQTVGGSASATVRGTKWLVADSCAGTVVQVDRGTVRVEDLVRHTTVTVTAGHSVRVAARGRHASSGGAGGSGGSFVAGVERLLGRLASGRTRLTAALGGAMNCSLSLHAAGAQIGGVIANRTTIRSSIRSLRARSAAARTVANRLRTAVTRSLAADRDYRSWLSGLERAHATCPLPRTGAYLAAGRADTRATRAKRLLVAAFNPMARRAHRRTWKADEI